MAYAPPQTRFPPAQHHYNPQNDRRPPPPQQRRQQPQYDQAYQQDWPQQGYEDYGYQNGYGQYEGAPYSDGQQYDQVYDGRDAHYDQGYNNYAYEQPQRPPPSDPSLRPDPRSPNGLNGPPSSGLRGPPRGAPRDPYTHRPPPQDPRQRLPRPQQHQNGVSPIDQPGWDNPFPTFPSKNTPRYPAPNGRRSGEAPRDVRNEYRPSSGNPHQRTYSQDQYIPEQSYSNPPDQGYGDPRQRISPPRGHDGSRDRAPLPQLQSVRHPPRDQRPTTATGTRPPPGRPSIPQYSQTQPSTPVAGSFGAAMDGLPDGRGWREPGSGAPDRNFNLPFRPETAPSRYRPPIDDDMPAFANTSDASAISDHGVPGLDHRDLPGHNGPPQPEGQRFEMPGDIPDFPVGSPINNGPSPPPNLGLARSQTAGPYYPPGPQERPPPPRRQMTEEGRSYTDDRKGPFPRDAPPNGYGMSRPPYADTSAPRPSTSGGSRPNLDPRGRPLYYGSSGPAGNLRLPPRQRNASLPRDSRDGPRGAPPNGPSHQGPPSQQSQQPQHEKKNSDALPYHPTPVRPGQLPTGQVDGRQKPIPVRQYDSAREVTSPKRPTKPQESPVTQAGLDSLRRDCGRKPSDYGMQLTLAKKLVEASRVLADEGGRADQRTRASNKERYIKEAKQVVKRLVSSNYPDAMFYLADSYGSGALGMENDPKEAFTLYQSAAKLGHAASAYRTAVCCEIGAEEGGGTRRDLGKAVAWYKRASSLGDVAAAYKMGIILLKGLLGQERNLGEAMSYLRQAADRADEENPHALQELAALYESPVSPKRDDAEALRLYTEGARLGYKFSQFRLGQVHENGQLGAVVDARQSIIWYTKAAAQGEHQSELALSGWYLTGAEGILEHSDTEAYLWARKAANAEPALPKAMFAMGYFTEVGIGCPRSLDEAKRWYGRAAAQGFPKARERLEELRRGGPNVQKKRENLSRSNQKKNEENCTVM